MNESGEYLLMFRRGKWDLPKGKQDPGETIEECALREVREETGLKDLVLGEFICETEHLYSEWGEDVVKRGYWYKMTASKNEKLKPQIEEDITDLKWVKPEELGYYLANTYPTILEVFRQGGAYV
jgi:8-oxo-dGTP pyrophosphatase MutT (NUDIX family)